MGGFIGCFEAELEVVSDRVAAEITKRTTLVLFSTGAGPHADAQYHFAEDVLDCTRPRPRHAKTYRDFRSELNLLQQERVNAFKAFSADVTNGGYPASEHAVAINDGEFEELVSQLKTLE